MSRTTLTFAAVTLLSLAACSGEPAETPPGPVPVDDAAFSITLSSGKLPVLQGTSGTVEVSLVRKGAFTGAVTIAATGLPSGATAAPLTLQPEQTSGTLTIETTAAAPHSLPTAVSVAGTSGTVQVTQPLTVTITGKPGSLDTSFAGGKAVIPVGASDDYAYAMAVQPDGKIVVAGRSAEHLGDFAVVRLERDGSLDATFGAGGKVATDFAGKSDIAYAVALQPDDKIILAGTSTGAGTGNDFALARYNSDGSLDTTFGAGGKVVTAFGDNADTIYALLLQPDGRIIAGGDSSQGTSVTGVDFALARYTPAGQLDPTFGAGGKVVTSLAASSGRDSIYALTFQEIGGENHIVAAGGEGDFALARYTPAGQLDVSFGTAGKVRGIYGSIIGAARAVKVDGAGNVLVAGHHTHDFALVRLGANGQLDATFGSGGKVVTPMSATNWDEAQGLAVDADGKIVVAGWAYESNSSSGNFALARYDGQGALDVSFGGTGMVVTEVAAPTKADQATAVLLQTDERVPTVRVLVAGYAGGANNDFAVTRYWR